MKLIYTLALSALSVNLAHAQTKVTIQELVTGTITFDNKFPHFVNTHQNNTGNVKPQRLVSRTYAWYDGSGFVTKDSSTFRFGGMRGGVPDIDDPMNDESILFDESIWYSNGNGLGFQPVERRKQTYNSGDKVHILTYGSWRAGWQDSLRYVYRYDNNKMVESGLEIPYGGMWTTHITSLMVYNGNKVVEMNATNYKMKFEYDAADNLVLFTDVQWNDDKKAWVSKERSTYTYSGTDMTTHNREMWDEQSGQWKFIRRKEFSYSGSNIASVIEYYYDQGSWQRDLKRLFSYNNTNNKDIETIQMWNPATGNFINSRQIVYRYNSYSMPESITHYTWDRATVAWLHTMGDKEYKYYYEAVFPTAIAQNQLDANVLKLYPVPAASNVNVDIDFDNAQQASITMLDMKGAVVGQWNELPTSHLHKQIDVSALPAGSYMVTVAAAGQRSSGRIVVAR